MTQQDTLTELVGQVLEAKLVELAGSQVVVFGSTPNGAIFSVPGMLTHMVVSGTSTWNVVQHFYADRISVSFAVPQVIEIFTNAAGVVKIHLN